MNGRKSSCFFVGLAELLARKYNLTQDVAEYLIKEYVFEGSEIGWKKRIDVTPTYSLPAAWMSERCADIETFLGVGP